MPTIPFLALNLTVFNTLLLLLWKLTCAFRKCLIKCFQLGYTKVCNHPQPPTTIHNHLKLHPQPPPKTTYNYPQPSTTTQKLPKKAKTCHKQLCYFTLDVNTETDVGFGSDMKQWYIYMCVCVCVYILFKSLYLLFFG